LFTKPCTLGETIKITGIATAYAKAHDLNHTDKNPVLNPMFTDITVNVTNPVVMLPIVIANNILCFIITVLTLIAICHLLFAIFYLLFSIF